GGEIQHDVVAVGNQVLVVAEDIKPGVVEGSNRVEEADADGLSDRVVLYKNSKAQNGSDQLEDDRGDKDVFNEGDNPFSGIQIDRFLDDRAPLEIHAFAHCKNDACADGGHAKPADLNQGSQNELTERSKGIARIHGN